MKYYGDPNYWVIIFKKGEDFFDCLSKFATEQKIKTGWFRGLGAVLNVELGYYDLSEQTYRWRVFSGPLEIVSLEGNIVTKDGKLTFHAHGSFSNNEYEVTGGHIKNMVIGGTCELLVSIVETTLTRIHDSEVGLDLLSDETTF